MGSLEWFVFLCPFSVLVVAYSWQFAAWCVGRLRGEKPGPPPGRVYFVRVEGKDVFKIGFTRNLEARIRALQTSSPFPLELYHAVSGSMADEQRLHQVLSTERSTGEWFEGDVVSRFAWGVRETNSLDERVVFPFLEAMSRAEDRAEDAKRGAYASGPARGEPLH